MKTELKQRLTAFVDPTLLQRAKVRGALESLTISEVVEKALDAYAPLIEKNSKNGLELKFTDSVGFNILTPKTDLRSKRKAPKHGKNLTVSR